MNKAEEAFKFRHHAMSVYIGAALLAACGGSQPPIGAPGAMPRSQTPVIAMRSERGGSWMLPEAKNKDLLYVSDPSGGVVYIFSYPTLRAIGTLSGFGSPSGLCADPAGDVWITNQYPPKIIEYPHGGTKPIRTIQDPGQPFSCAVDTTTGDLAVTNDYGIKGSVAVYPKAKGKPKVYADPDIKHDLYVTYDGSGDLFVDGNSGKPLIAELLKGQGSLVTVRLNQKKMLPVSMQWDGNYLAVVNAYGTTNNPTVVDRIKVSGKTGKVVSKTFLKSRGHKDSDPVQYWIYENTIAGPDVTSGSGPSLLGLWNWPKGGRPIKEVQPSGDSVLWGTTVSQGKH